MLHGKQPMKAKKNQRVSRCKCGRVARRGQRNCHLCHADAQRAFRFRRKDQAVRIAHIFNRFAKMADRLEYALEE